MNQLMTPAECLPLVSAETYPLVDAEEQAAASIELRSSPNLVAYLRKLHLQALNDLGKIPVEGVSKEDLAIRYARIRTRLEVVSSLMELPHLVALHNPNEGDLQ